MSGIRPVISNSCSLLYLVTTHLLSIFMITIFFMPTACLAIDKPSEQYMNVAPLSGAGYALDCNGRPDGLGAMQVNIPLAYTLHPGLGGASIYIGKHSNSHGGETNNGSGMIFTSFGNYPRVFFSGMQVSSDLDEAKCVSMQVQVVRETANVPAIAVGVQDVLEKEDGNRTVYAVATKAFPLPDRNLYVTLGYGNGRFLNRPFIGVSAPVNDYLSASAEYDGYQGNFGIGWRPQGRRGGITLLGGYNGSLGFVAGVSVIIGGVSSSPEYVY